MFHHYPVCKTEAVCNDYIVTINGTSVDLNTASVSAFPFNRRWPGHQRSKDQSELINFLSFAFEDEVMIEITPKKPFENVVIRPKSLGIVPQTENGTIKFSLQKPAYFTVEPFGRKEALHIFADPMPNYKIDVNNNDVIYFGPGEHDADFIYLKSNQTLFLDEGAVVYGCVRAMDADHIKILGRGILDNSKNKEKILFEHNAENNDTAIKNAKREHTIQLEYCTDIQIEGITIRDSLVYNIRPLACKNLHISNVKIIGCWRYNSDGIDMHNCEDVLIENCFIRSFDDSICIKGFDCYYEGDVEEAVKKAMYRNGKAYDVFKNVLVRNCVIWNDWGRALEIGAETRAEEICDITFTDCDIIHVTASPLDCCNIDYADVHHVIYKNITVEYDDVIPQPLIQKNDSHVYPDTDTNYSPYLIFVLTSYHQEYSAGGTRRGRCYDIRFENIRLYGKQKPKLYFIGYDSEHQTKDIVIENIIWNDALLTEIPEEDFVLEEFTENIVYRTKENQYAQLEKNNVAAKNQLKQPESVHLINPEGKGKRIMFVGNSITLHGILPSIGWHGKHGMAASKKENDYVHLLMAKTNEISSDSQFCICQVAEWEREFFKGQEKLSLYESARNFDADIIIMRFIENCPKDHFDSAIFKKETALLFNYLNKSQKAKLILTTGFWKHPGDEVLIEYAKENNLPCVTLGDLGELDEMKAIGLFEHKGVANHPGDLGMKHIADRIWEKLKILLLNNENPHSV